MKKQNPDTKTADRPAIRFSKAKILTFQRYAHRRDLLGEILKSDRSYSLEEVDAAIEKFEKGKVK